MNSKALLCVLSLALPVAAQRDHNLVTNGDFTGTLAPWVLGGGYSCTPQLDTTYATDGITVSDSFSCGPGGQVTPAPYPANTIEQPVSLVAGTTYELRADVSSSRATSSGTNADAGTIYAQVNGVEVARITFGQIIINETKRAFLSGRFVAAATGTVNLTIFFERRFLCNTGTPRVNVDNVELEDTTGATYNIAGNRKIGTTVNFTMQGDANAAYATFLSAGQFPGGVPIPGFNGLWFLDFTGIQLVLSGVLDGAGQATTPIAIPNNVQLKSVPLYHQGLTVGATNELSFAFGCVFTN